MHLRHNGHATLSQAFNDHHLPKRAVGVERSTDKICHQLVKLATSSGLRQARSAQMVVQIKVRVVDPDGMMKAKRHLDRSLAHRHDLVDSALNKSSDLGESSGGREERPSALWRIEHEDGSDMQHAGRGLQGQESGVNPVERIHVSDQSEEADSPAAVSKSTHATFSLWQLAFIHFGERCHLHALNHELGYPITRNHLIRKVGVEIDEEDLELSSVTRVNETGCVETRHAVLQRQTTSRLDKPGEPWRNGNNQPSRHQCSTASGGQHHASASVKVGTGVTLSGVARNGYIRIDPMDRHGQHRTTLPVPAMLTTGAQPRTVRTPLFAS